MTVTSVAQRSPFVDALSAPSKGASSKSLPQPYWRASHVPPCHGTAPCTFPPQFSHRHKALPAVAELACHNRLRNSLPFLRPLFLCCSPILTWLICLTFCFRPTLNFPHNRPASPLRFLSRRAARLGRKRALSAPGQTNPSSPCHTKARERPVELQ
jgi:hypothetical protein